MRLGAMAWVVVRCMVLGGCEEAAGGDLADVADGAEGVGDGGAEATTRDGDGGSQGSPLLGLAVKPEEADVVEHDLEGGTVVRLAAIGTFAEGERSVTQTVRWTVSNEAIGTVDAAGRFVTSGLGGQTEVVASEGELSDAATIHVVLDVVDVVPGVREDAPTFFTAAPSGDATDFEILYITSPSDDTRFGAGAAPPTITCLAKERFELFEFRFASPHGDVRLYAATPLLTVSEQAWHAIAASNVGGQVVLSVRAVRTAASAEVYSAQHVELFFDD